MAGFDCVELLPLDGKNPRRNGGNWPDAATSSAERLSDLIAISPWADGLGLLCRRVIAFDVDRPEVVPPPLMGLLRGGLVNETRPGRRHYIFRVPDGVRYGGSDRKIREAFKIKDKWGEIRAWNAQVRIWSPNGDGTHVALVPGPIPELPMALASLLLPPGADGESVSSGELDDWLDAHDGNDRPGWLSKVVEKMRMAMRSESKYEAMVRHVFIAAGDVAGEAYPGRVAYDTLLDAYREECDIDHDWDGDRLPKYRTAWRGAVGKWERDPELLKSVAEKKERIKTGGDVELTETEAAVIELLKAAAGGATVTRSDLTRAMAHEDMSALLTARSADDDEPGSGEDSSTIASEPTSEPYVHSEHGDPSDPSVPSVPSAEPDEALTPLELLLEYLRALGPEAGSDTRSHFVSFAKAVERLEPAEQAKQVGFFLAKDARSQAAFLSRMAGEFHGREAKAFVALVEASGTVDVEPVTVELDWVDVKPPTALLRGDGVGLLYEGGVSHSLVGDAASGKTTLALVAAVERLRAGQVVVWVDFEMGIKRLTNWLMRLGAPRDAVRERFHVVDFVGSDGQLADALRIIRRVKPDWVVVDSVSRALHRAGVTIENIENTSSGFIGFIDRFVSHCVDGGASVVLIDHTGHAEKTRARGSSAKSQQIDVTYSVRVVKPWSREKDGVVELTCQKDRDGFFTAGEPSAFATVSPRLTDLDPERRRVDIVIVEPTAPAALVWLTGVTATVRKLMEDVLDVLEGSTDPVSAADVAKALGADPKDVRSALYELKDDGRTVVSGVGRGAKWSLAPASGS